MSHPHPIRKIPSVAAILEVVESAAPSRSTKFDIEESISSVNSIGCMFEEMQTKLSEQTALITQLRKENGELVLHKEAAYSEMVKAEAALKVERDRAERAEQLYHKTCEAEREAQENIKRLVLSVRNTFGCAERAAAA